MQAVPTNRLLLSAWFARQTLQQPLLMLSCRLDSNFQHLLRSQRPYTFFDDAAAVLIQQADIVASSSSSSSSLQPVVPALEASSQLALFDSQQHQRRIGQQAVIFSRSTDESQVQQQQSACQNKQQQQQQHIQAAKVQQALIVMELCPRGTLWEAIQAGVFHLEQQQQPAMQLMLCILTQLAAALQHLHSLGIVHQDLTSHNVLLVDDPSQPHGVQAKIADFGECCTVTLCSDLHCYSIPIDCLHHLDP